MYRGTMRVMYIDRGDGAEVGVYRKTPVLDTEEKYKKGDYRTCHGFCDLITNNLLPVKTYIFHSCLVSDDISLGWSLIHK